MATVIDVLYQHLHACKYFVSIFLIRIMCNNVMCNNYNKKEC